MVATGSGPGPNVEIANLDDSNPDLVCEDLPDYPFYVSRATGQLYNNKYPVICGGEISYPKYVTICDCFSLKDGSWKGIASLTECRDSAASALFSNPNNNEEDILLITGGRNGRNGRNASSTVESFDGKIWSRNVFAHLPTPISDHCLVKINNTMLLQIGGTLDTSYSGATANTYFFDILMNMWSPGPELNVGRIQPSCEVMNWMNPDTGIEEKVR